MLDPIKQNPTVHGGSIKTAVFFHTRLSGGYNVDSGAAVEPGWGRSLFLEQMAVLVKSGLAEAAQEFFIGFNGSRGDWAFVCDNTPAKAKILQHGENARSLLPTMRFLQDWLPGHEDWAVFFSHAKGACHPNDPLTTRWRNCMTRHCITNWRRCVADLEAGYDAVGCHWLHNRPNDPNADRWGANSYFGGVFWGSKARYLLTLPPLPDLATDRHSFYLPELWLGNGKPKVKDYAQGHAIGACP
jgi:hypothetical protein